MKMKARGRGRDKGEKPSSSVKGDTASGAKEELDK